MPPLPPSSSDANRRANQQEQAEEDGKQPCKGSARYFSFIYCCPILLAAHVASMPHAIGLVPHRHRLFVLHRTFIGRFGNLIFISGTFGRGCHDRAHRILFALCLRSIFACTAAGRSTASGLRLSAWTDCFADATFCLSGCFIRSPASRLSDRRTFMRLGCRFACCAAGNLCHTNSIHRRRPSPVCLRQAVAWA